MKESNKFLIVIVIVAIFSIGALAITGVALMQISQNLMPENPNAEIKNETFNSTTISVPVTSNFTEQSGVFVDKKNQLIIQVMNETIPQNQKNAYSKVFEKQFNATLINSSNLPDNIIAFKGAQNNSIVLVMGEKQTVVVMASNQELALKIAKSVKFNG
ncbi:hypothetical protein KQY27_01020 [Methanobrevibacter sp. TMH8]|uniref:hypothetical protein n=1 Tax=Methanobrevibacter sp. TMH8 TaxID=2848611 RepID=UPI001CCB6A84|nr:hypothetical protein [Methanobrevibacter sp. TMH8]MBZ9570136.1 hypothetical protein [Methanobrevibacter sp. TMH8]